MYWCTGYLTYNAVLYRYRYNEEWDSLVYIDLENVRS